MEIIFTHLHPYLLVLGPGDVAGEADKTKSWPYPSGADHEVVE